MMSQSPNATKRRHGTTNTTRSPNESTGNYLPRPPTNAYAPNGNEKKAARNENASATFAQDAELQLMELTDALSLRSVRPQTPYKPDAWEQMLRIADLVNDYGDIPNGLRYGFKIDFPNITHVQSPPNSPSVTMYHEQLDEIVQKEISKGRYIGPLPLSIIENIIGPYQSSPLSIIPKPGKPGKFRLVQNFSFPLSPNTTNPSQSINSYIDSTNFPASWGKFSIVYLLISRLPPGSEAATRDVAEAYRTVPLHPSQWPAAVVRISHTHGCIDTCTAFGATPSAGIYGHIADAAVDLFRHQGIGPLDKWVDDHIFLRIPREHLTEYNEARGVWHQSIKPTGKCKEGSRNFFRGRLLQDGSHEEFNENCAHPIRDLSRNSPRSEHDAVFTYNLDDIDNISFSLGIPWETSKDQPFDYTTTYIGFVWNIRDRSVSLSPQKTKKYIEAIHEWNARPAHCLDQVQKLYGKLLHTSSLIPAGRAYLTGLERMLAVGAIKPFLPHRPEKTVAGDLDWWLKNLLTNTITRSITPPPIFEDPQAFSDASSGIGIGVVVGARWRAWRLIPGWQERGGKRDIAWAEAIGFEFLISSLARIASIKPYLLVHGDNTSVIESWRVGRHRNNAVNDVFKRIHSLLADESSPILSVITRFVPSGENPADNPSRGIYSDPSLLLPHFPIPSHLSELVIHFSDPLHPRELRAIADGNPPTATTKFLNRLHREQEARERALVLQREDDAAIEFALHNP